MEEVQTRTWGSHSTRIGRTRPRQSNPCANHYSPAAKRPTRAGLESRRSDKPGSSRAHQSCLPGISFGTAVEGYRLQRSLRDSLTSSRNARWSVRSAALGRERGGFRFARRGIDLPISWKKRPRFEVEVPTTRVNNIFLAGDASHAHSPAAGPKNGEPMGPSLMERTHD